MIKTYHPDALTAWSLENGDTVVLESHGFQFVVEKIVLDAIVATHVRTEE